MFEKASRMKLRFAYKGSLIVEDLWDLSVEELDKIYQELKQQLNQIEVGSLLGRTIPEELQLKVDIVKHIVNVKLAEAESVKTLAADKQRREKIMEILSRKQDSALENLSEEELRAMLCDIK